LQVRFLPLQLWRVGKQVKPTDKTHKVIDHLIYEKLESLSKCDAAATEDVIKAFEEVKALQDKNQK